MLKRLLAALGAVIGATAIGVAANLSLVTGPQDPSQLNATINALIQSINTSVSRIGVASTAVASAGTTAEQTLLQYTLPGGLLANPGDSIRIGCWGIGGTNTDTKTVKLYFGSTVIASPAGTGSNVGWRLAMSVMRRTATTQSVDSWGLVGTTPVSPVNADAAETLSAGVLVKCTAITSATAADVTAQGLLVEAIR